MEGESFTFFKKLGPLHMRDKRESSTFYFLINILILVTRENTVSNGTLFTTKMSFISGNLQFGDD